MIVGTDGRPLRSTPATFDWDRPTPREWEEQLDAAFPRREGLTWLYLAWVAGTPEEPIQRWVVYEATPESALGTAIVEALHYMATQERASDHTAEEQRILRYWLEHRALLRTFWIVQGEGGGHKYRFDRTEAKMLELMGLPSEPPLPGDLPYAPFDGRVLEQLRRWDLLRTAHADLRAAREQANREAAQQWRRTFMDWLQKQLTLENVYRDVDFESGAKRVEHEAMPEDRLAAIEEHYVQTGNFLH